MWQPLRAGCILFRIAGQGDSFGVVAAARLGLALGNALDAAGPGWVRRTLWYLAARSGSAMRSGSQKPVSGYNLKVLHGARRTLAAVPAAGASKNHGLLTR